MKRFIGSLVLVILFAGVAVSMTLKGDLDEDGDVDFDDFFIFAQNFGRKLSPEDVPGLSAIEVSAEEANFDPNPGTDGWRITVKFLNSVGNSLTTKTAFTAQIKYDIRVEVGRFTYRGFTNKPDTSISVHNEKIKAVKVEQLNWKAEFTITFDEFKEVTQIAVKKAREQFGNLPLPSEIPADGWKVGVKYIDLLIKWAALLGQERSRFYGTFAVVSVQMVTPTQTYEDVITPEY